jgi:hypothetical protein
MKGCCLLAVNFVLAMEFFCHFAKNVYKKKDIYICIQAMTNLRIGKRKNLKEND